MKAVGWIEVTADLWLNFLDSPLRIFAASDGVLKGSIDSIGIDGAIHIELNCILCASAHGVFTAHTVYEKPKALTL